MDSDEKRAEDIFVCGVINHIVEGETAMPHDAGDAKRLYEGLKLACFAARKAWRETAPETTPASMGQSAPRESGVPTPDQVGAFVRPFEEWSGESVSHPYVKAAYDGPATWEEIFTSGNTRVLEVLANPRDGIKGGKWLKKNVEQVAKAKAVQALLAKPKPEPVTVPEDDKPLPWEEPEESPWANSEEDTPF